MFEAGAIIALVVLAVGLLVVPRPNDAGIAAPLVSSRARRLADAIATAEGFFVSGSRPERNNNPGNLTVDIAGGGVGVGHDGPFIVYGSAADGWSDLYAQIELMLSGGSRYYRPSMSIEEMARVYTQTEQSDWAANVAGALGVPVTRKISEV